MRGLTPRQARFVDEYLVDLNASQAARRAGYSSRTADQQGFRLLRNDQVRRGIAARRQQLAEKLHVKQERVLRELARIAFSDLADVARWGPDGMVLLDSARLSADVRAAVESVRQTETGHGGSVAVKLHDKVRALDLLARHLGMYPEPPPAQIQALVPVQIIVSGHDNV